MADTVTIGFDSIVTVNSVTVGSRGGSMVFHADTHDTTTTLSATQNTVLRPSRVRTAGLREAEITLNFQYATDFSPHSVTYGINEGSRVSITVDVNGTGDPYILTDVLLDSFQSTPVGDPSQPNQFSLHGYTGDYQKPDE